LGELKLKVLPVHDLNPLWQTFSKIVVLVINRVLGKRVMITGEEDNRSSPRLSPLE
jgi:hypothetical protein